MEIFKNLNTKPDLSALDPVLCTLYFRLEGGEEELETSPCWNREAIWDTPGIIWRTQDY